MSKWYREKVKDQEEFVKDLELKTLFFDQDELTLREIHDLNKNRAKLHCLKQGVNYGN